MRLIEFLAVILIVATLTALVTVGVRAAIVHSKKVVCLNRLNDIGHATMLYESDHNGYMPPQSFYGLPQSRAPIGIDVADSARAYTKALGTYGLLQDSFQCVEAERALVSDEDIWSPKLGTLLLNYRMTTRYGEPAVTKLQASSNIAWNVRVNPASVPEPSQTVSHFEILQGLSGGSSPTSYHDAPASGLYIDGHVTRLQSNSHTTCWFPGIENFLGIPTTTPCFR